MTGTDAPDERRPAAARADLSNWRRPPFSRWAFRNVRAILPTEPIEASRDAWALPLASARPFDDFAVRDAGGADLDLAAFLRATATDAIVVLHDGRIVHEGYGNGNAARDAHILMSATKSVVGLLVGILDERGDLDVDAPASAYVPEIAATAYRDATIRQLLDMRTGVALDAGQLRAYVAAANWDPVEPAEASANLHAFFAGLSAPRADHGGRFRHAAHGGPFRYVSANTDLLGWVIERAAGRSVATLLSTLLWQPMGAADAAAITLDRRGAARCTGGLCASARDLARLGQLVVEGGRRGSVAVVPERWIDDIAANGDRDAWRAGEFAGAFGARTMSYRSGWYVTHDAPAMMSAMGVHGQTLFVDRANRIVVAKLSSLPSPIDVAATALTHRAVDAIRRCLLRSPR